MILFLLLCLFVSLGVNVFFYDALKIADAKNEELTDMLYRMVIP